MEFTREALMDIYGRLFAAYGTQRWWPAKHPFEMMMGAVLTQNTSWGNVVRALDRLGRDTTPGMIAEMPEGELADRIRPVGYFNQKAKSLKAIAAFALDTGVCPEDVRTVPDAELRRRLLRVRGVGRETADSILLYAYERPVFVIDAYTRRLFGRLGFDVPPHYDAFAACFTRNLSPDASLFNEYHALIVRHAKAPCTKRRMDCAACVLACPEKII